LVTALASAALTFALGLILDVRATMGRFLFKESDAVRLGVYLKNSADSKTVEAALRAQPGVRGIRFISKDEALELARADPSLSASLTLTGGNPFPASFEVGWEPAFLRPDYLDPTATKIAEVEGVDALDYDRPRVDRLALLARFQGQWEAALAVAGWAAVFLAALMAGRLLVFSHRPVPFPRLAWGLGAGFLGGVVGAAVAGYFVYPRPWPVMAAGPAAGLLAALFESALSPDE
jgi:cell division protein FtsX